MKKINRRDIADIEFPYLRTKRERVSAKMRLIEKSINEGKHNAKTHLLLKLSQSVRLYCRKCRNTHESLLRL